LGLSCNVVCSPFYSSRGAHTRILSPDMWAHGQMDGRKVLLPLTPGRSLSAIISVVHTVLISWGSTLGNARVMMSVVHAAAWAYCLPTKWTGTPPAEWPGRRPSAEWTGHIKCRAAHRMPVEWTGLIKCWGGTSPASGVDRAH
jgi:hypothetical protein